jgi:hypothetical protein
MPMSTTSTAIEEPRYGRMHYSTGSAAAKPMTMLFYHYAPLENIFSIAAAGLIPGVPDPPIMVLDNAVVWLSTNASRISPAEDIAHLKLTGNWEEKFKEIRFGHDDDICVTVRLSPNSSRLSHYATWFRKEAPGLNMLEMLSPSILKDWWIYRGTIPRDKIEIPDLTRDQIINVCNRNLAKNDLDEERRAMYIGTIAQVKDAPPDGTFSIGAPGP